MGEDSRKLAMHIWCWLAILPGLLIPIPTPGTQAHSRSGTQVHSRSGTQAPSRSGNQAHSRSGPRLDFSIVTFCIRYRYGVTVVHYHMQNHSRIPTVCVFTKGVRQRNYETGHSCLLFWCISELPQASLPYLSSWELGRTSWLQLISSKYRWGEGAL